MKNKKLFLRFKLFMTIAHRGHYLYGCREDMEVGEDSDEGYIAPIRSDMKNFEGTWEHNNTWL